MRPATVAGTEATESMGEEPYVSSFLDSISEGRCNNRLEKRKFQQISANLSKIVID